MGRKYRKVRCRAKSKRTGQQCRAWPVGGFAVCRVHGAGHPRKGKPGGRPPGHGLYSAKVAADLQGAMDGLRQDPHLTDGFMDIARIRALTVRAQDLLREEERAYLALEEQAEGGAGQGGAEALAKARNRLLTWYERLAALAAATLAGIERYYGAIERKGGGVSAAAVDASLMALLKILHQRVPDEALREAIFADLRTEFKRIVVPGNHGCEG